MNLGKKFSILQTREKKMGLRAINAGWCTREQRKRGNDGYLKKEGSEEVEKSVVSESEMLNIMDS